MNAAAPTPQSWKDCGREAAERCILPLSADDDAAYKGSSGRIAVLGGSAKYTGAPYYAAAACLQAGADLAYVFTAQEATIPIKCYSPELMVASVYSAKEFDAAVATKKASKKDETNADDEEKKERLVQGMVREVTEHMARLHCLVIGPGLGRCPLVFEAVARIIRHAVRMKLPLVLDADALYMLSLEPYRNLLRGYRRAILTPNAVEYKRLFPQAVAAASGDPANNANDALVDATVIQKGKHDVILRGSKAVRICQEPGGLKRSGGIGDVLAGTTAALAAWNSILQKKNKNNSKGSSDKSNDNDDNEDDDLLLPLAAWTACCFVKRATARAFAAKHRAMTAPDVLSELGAAIHEMTCE